MERQLKDDEKPAVFVNEIGKKFDAGKVQWGLIIGLKGLGAAARVATFGAGKYGPENWRLVSDAKRRYTNAAFRHLVAWHRGEANDPETGESHLAHAICNLLFLSELS